MLVRWATEHGISGVGVDLSEVFVRAARRRATELAVADRVLIEQGDAGAYVCEPGSFDVACCLGATWIGGGVAGTIDLLRRAVGADGLLLIGEPFWREEPPAAARAALGGSPDEFSDLAGLLEVFDTAGVDLVEMVLADEHGWDRYEAAQWWPLRQWLDAHPDDPMHTQVRHFREKSGAATSPTSGATSAGVSSWSDRPR